MVAFLVPPLRGFKRIQDTVNPRKAKKAMNDAMDVALDHYFDALVADSRVKSGKYKGSWRRTGSRGSREIRNAASTKYGIYASYVTGKNMLPQPRRGASEGFWNQIRRRESRRVKAKMIKAFRNGIRS